MPEYEFPECDRLDREAETCAETGARTYPAWCQLCKRNPAYLNCFIDLASADKVVGEVKRNKAKPKPCGGCGKPPSIASMTWDVVKSGVKFFASGCQFVDRDEYERRLAICDGCEHRGDERVKGNEHRCGECGCYVAVKAEGKAWKCPIGKWEVVTAQAG